MVVLDFLNDLDMRSIKLEWSIVSIEELKSNNVRIDIYPSTSAHKRLL